MAIMGFIIVVAGRAFSDSTGMRIRSQNMLASSEEAGRISALLKEDISQVGVKSYGTSSASSYVFVESVYNSGTPNSGDISSFALEEEETDQYDRLSFKKAIFGDDGTCRAAVEVEWFVDVSVPTNPRLMRTCAILSSVSAQCPTPTSLPECVAGPVEMASGITEFRFFPSIPGREGSGYSIDPVIFPSPSTPNNYRFLVRTPSTVTANLESKTIADGKITLSGFNQLTTANHNPRTEAFLAETGTGNNLNNCKAFVFAVGEEYSVYFEMPRTNIPGLPYNYIDNFQPGKDHLSIGLRDPSSGNPIANGPPDFLFYPPQADEAGAIGKTQRLFEFSIPENVAGLNANELSACIAITAAFYSPNVHLGTLEFQNFKVSRKIDKVYHFDTTAVKSSTMGTVPTTAQKSQVKAFQLVLGVRKGGRSADDRKNETNRTLATIPVPNNGIAGGN